MNRAFVLGNGISRKAIVTSHLSAYGPVYGCNALYREFTPDVLVATDTPIAVAIQDSGYALKHRFHTRKPIIEKGALDLLPKYQGYSSGPNAVALAALDGARTIYLIGFDMGGTAEHKFNNVYADTEFYLPSRTKPTFAGNWVRQLTALMREYPNTKFIRIIDELSTAFVELDGMPNYSRKQMSWFKDIINGNKELTD